MSVERTVTFTLPKNVDEFLTAYAKLLKCESVEEFLREEIQQHFSAENIECLLESYFDNDAFLNQVRKNYGLKLDTREKITS